MKLRGRVAIITGAGSGIGAATAMAMAREGARVVVADIDREAAERVSDKIGRDGGVAMGIATDVTLRGDNEDLVERVLSSWGSLDIFMANAGIAQVPAPIEETDEATFERIFAVNVKGVWLGARYAIPRMKLQRRGVFLVTGSTSAIRPRPGRQIYAASKSAVVNLVKSLALECAPYGVRAVAIAPVATETPMLATFLGKEEVDEEELARYVAAVPLGRLNQPDDIANAAVFLASDDAAMITGTCLEVDGGRCI